MYFSGEKQWKILFIIYITKYIIFYSTKERTEHQAAKILYKRRDNRKG